jgi:hypothetical protein
MLLGAVIKEFAKDALVASLGSYAGDAQDAVVNTVRDTFESIITGRRTLEEWADIAIKGVDKIKDRIVTENNWTYVGGTLNFAMSKASTDKVVISFELYYQDENKKWQKVGAESDMYASNFTLEALDDIESKGTVSFEVE